jgi:G3E family GTPase
VTTPLPCVLLSGWLGAGKTTLLNQVLKRSGGRRVAVLVNDFGDLGIDAALIEGATDEVLELAGGCICCSFGADLLGTVRRVRERQPPPDMLLIEASGVSDPAAVCRTLRLDLALARPGVIGVADARALRQQADDPYIGDTVRQQLQAAQLLLLNKVDTVTAGTLGELLSWLVATAPQARVVQTIQADVPADLVLGLAPLDGPLAFTAPGQADQPEPTDPRYETPRSLQAPRPAASIADRLVTDSRLLDVPQDIEALARELTAPGRGVLRAKGLATDGQGRRWLLQQVGAALQIDPAPLQARGPDRLAVIALRHLYDPTSGS